MPDDTQRQDSEKLRSRDQYGAGADTGEAPEDTYEPSAVEVNRAREQGLGVGQKDIDYQHDPIGVTPAERWVNPDPGPRVRPPDPLPPELDPPA
jgi:hypothetical protein